MSHRVHAYTHTRAHRVCARLLTTAVCPAWCVACALSARARVCERRGELRGCGQSDALPWNREGPDPTGIEPGRDPYTSHHCASWQGARWIIGISTPTGIKCFNYDYYRNAAELCAIVHRDDTWEPRRGNLWISWCTSGRGVIFVSFRFFSSFFFLIDTESSSYRAIGLFENRSGLRLGWFDIDRLVELFTLTISQIKVMRRRRICVSEGFDQSGIIKKNFCNITFCKMCNLCKRVSICILARNFWLYISIGF